MMQSMPGELAREHQQSILAEVEANRVGARARLHRRAVRRAERAERRLMTQWDQAMELQAEVRELELTH